MSIVAVVEGMGRSRVVVEWRGEVREWRGEVREWRSLSTTDWFWLSGVEGKAARLCGDVGELNVKGRAAVEKVLWRVWRK